MGRKPTLLARTIADRLYDHNNDMFTPEHQGIIKDRLAGWAQKVLDERARILKEEDSGRDLRPEPKERWITVDGERRLISGN